MNNLGFRDMVQYAWSRQGMRCMIGCFVKGVVFYWFIKRSFREEASEDRIMSTVSQAGDDIYPLF